MFIIVGENANHGEAVIISPLRGFSWFCFRGYNNFNPSGFQSNKCIIVGESSDAGETYIIITASSC